MNDWRADRAKAFELKDHASGFGRDTCYECDDKCGSHWLMMPVAPEGRDTKDLAKHKFDFAIQSNTVVGKGGVNRFMVVPYHTGSNFGLTSFIVALYGAYKNGRFNEGAGKTLYRHTSCTGSWCGWASLTSSFGSASTLAILTQSSATAYLA